MKTLFLGNGLYLRGYIIAQDREREGAQNTLTESTDTMKRSGWGKADVPMHWTDEDDYSDNEWEECDPPSSSSRSIEDEKVQQAKEEADEVAEICGFK